MGFKVTIEAKGSINLGIETLPLRIRKHSENALAVAKHLQSHPKISRVIYPGLESDPSHELSKKYLTDGLCSGVLSLDIKGVIKMACKKGGKRK